MQTFHRREVVPNGLHLYTYAMPEWFSFAECDWEYRPTFWGEPSWRVAALDDERIMLRTLPLARLASGAKWRRSVTVLAENEEQADAVMEFRFIAYTQADIDSLTGAFGPPQKRLVGADGRPLP